MEEVKRKDKHLYCYKQALSQPYWVQRLSDSFSFKNPIRFSWFVYGVVIFLFTWFFLGFVFPFLSIGPRGMGSLFLAVWLGRFLSEMVVDGKDFIFFLIDYLFFYINYGMNVDKSYINKGMLYKKVKRGK